jgi:homoserine O-succinyltransferase/O-acetyltransferase
MPLLLDTARSGAAVELRGVNCMTIGLVNNMPDAACEATERQFLDLLRGATSNAVVHLKLFSIADVPRADHVRQELAARYRDISELWDTRLDGLIVTGTEPRAANLKDEPYWATLAKLVDWARQNTVSTIWSCLATHAAVLHADGIARRPLQEKKFGVFDCEIASAHPLTTGMKPRLSVPHSRYNDLPERALAAAGYRLLTRSTAASADAFVREEQGGSLFVFFQGHPEYETDTLAREYRRDVGRFLRGERENYPAAPEGYFNDAAPALVNDFRARAVGDRRASLMADFPFAALELALENTWRRSAIDIYENWIVYLKDRKAERRTAMVPARGSRRDARRIGGLLPAADRRSTG